MNIYAKYSNEELEELFSNYLIDSWSYSKVTSFSRNEKEFERCYIYREPSKRSASSVAGNAYHTALEFYFNSLIDGAECTIVDLECVAFDYIDEIKACDWKLQKTTPTVEECMIKANKIASSLIKNFFSEIGVYREEIAKVLGVELRLDEWLTVNGVDIPLPCHMVIDLVVELLDGRTVIIDHKSKSRFTDEKELKFVCGKQAITYLKGYEANTGKKVDEVWFIENKHTTNGDKSAQLKKFAIVFDKDTRRLYEAMLYEPLKRMIEAVSDPDYVYTINDNDNFTDLAETYEFWAKTMISEVEDFQGIAENKKELIKKRQKKIRDASITINPTTISTFKENAASFITYDLTNKNMTNTEKIEHVLRVFGIIVKVQKEVVGYSSNTYLVEVSAGVKVSNVLRYKLDIANALNVSNVRIGSSLTVYEGKSYISIETSKKRTEDLLFDAKYLDGLKLPIGVDNYDRVVRWDLDNNSTPHMLICGATGSGKSVSILSTIAYAKLAGITDIIVFDPKYEFCNLDGADVYNDIDDIEEQMRLLVEEMQNRAKSGERSKKLVIFDEFADAVASSRSGAELDVKDKVQVGFYAPKKGPLGFLMAPEPKYEIKTVDKLKSLEENLKMLLQKGRSLGFRIIAATQRASVKVITGDAKVNFPVQVCFRVPKEVDSKVVLDEAGAECLAGSGDGLFKSPEYLDVVRFQGFYKK